MVKKLSPTDAEVEVLANAIIMLFIEKLGSIKPTKGETAGKYQKRVISIFEDVVKKGGKACLSPEK